MIVADERDDSWSRPLCRLSIPLEIISHAGVVARCRSATPSGGLLERIAEDDRSMSTRAN
jgi:hypothetical protein